MEKHFLKTKAEEITGILQELPAVKGCRIYGSLSSDRQDELSDIDIEVDVSGCDNGQFMIELPQLLKSKLHIFYSDYAPSLISEAYIVSLALDEYNPFLIVDINCSARPHCATVTRQQVMEKNNRYTHFLKLWTANLKHYVRGAACCGDIVRMAVKLNIDFVDTKNERELLEETLCWLEENVYDGLYIFVRSCREWFDKLI